MNLKTRTIFVDTSVYRNKNFQFGTHSLAALQKMLSEGKLTLLITDVTISEIKEGMKVLAKKITSDSQKMKKNASFLQDDPEVAHKGFLEFSKLSESTIYEKVENKFNDLINSKNCKIISVDTVKPSEVFSRYFNEKPPFGKGKKKSEFPDAFVLNAIQNSEEYKNSPIYLVSTDDDMKYFANEFKGEFIHVNSLEDIINEINRTEPSYKWKFLNEISNSLENEIKDLAIENLNYGDFVAVTRGQNMHYDYFAEIGLSDIDREIKVEKNCNIK